jgi:hypothetical protein
MQVKDLVALLLTLDQNATVEAIAELEELNLNITSVEEVVPAEDSKDGKGLVFLYCAVIDEE